MEDRHWRLSTRRTISARHLQCVKKLASAKGLDWNTKNSDEKSLLEVAREKENDAMVRYLEDTDATLCLESEIREAISQTQAIKQNINALEEEVEVERREHEALMERRRNLWQNYVSFKKGQVENERAALADLQNTIVEKQRQLKARAGHGGQHQKLPECSICMEEMVAPVQVYSCKNGHLICGTCKPSTTSCTTCDDREGYTFRNVAVELMIQQRWWME